MNEPTKLSADQARMNAVIAQRNHALNAVAEHEALITVLSQQLDEVTKERDALKAKYETDTAKEPEHGSPA